MPVEEFANADGWQPDYLKTQPIRIALVAAQPLAVSDGPGWREIRKGPGSDEAPDCWLLGDGDAALAALEGLQRTGAPIVIQLTEAAEPWSLLDAVDGYLLPDDDAAAMAAVFAAVTRKAPHQLQVRDLSDGAARTINALSAEAGRIANALAELADVQRSAPVSDVAVDAVLVRRLLRVRRDRERFFPREIFADPAWDCLLDLMAARLEGKRVPVSSLCIAAQVPTTTALRWIRNLTDAGLFERCMDPDDARRAHISLTDVAVDGIAGWLRAFSAQFSLR